MLATLATTALRNGGWRQASLAGALRPAAAAVPSLLQAHCYSTVKPDVKLLSKLRKQTEMSMTQCREALVQANNNYDNALQWLEDQAQALGQAKASKLGGRVASEGLVAVATDGPVGAMVELNCETDFVSRNDLFQELARKAAKAVLMMKPAAVGSADISMDVLKSTVVDETGKTLAESLTAAVGKIGENMSLRRAVQVVGKEGSVIGSYVHSSIGQADLGRIGVLVAVTQNASSVGRQLATHIAGMKPADVSELLQQPFVFDSNRTVGEVVQGEAAVGAFVRFECGEGLEKKNEDFAAEVAKQMGKA